MGRATISLYLYMYMFLFIILVIVLYDSVNVVLILCLAKRMRKSRSTPNNVSIVPRRASQAQLLSQPGELKALTSVRAATKSARSSLKGSPAHRILCSMTLPKDVDYPVRIGSAFGSDPTATAKLFRRLNLIFPQLSTPQLPGDLSPTDMAGFIYRDALRSFIYAFGMSATDTYLYTTTYVAEINYSPGVEYYPQYETPPAIDLAVSTISPHGEYLYPGRNGKSDLKRGFLVSQQGFLTVVIPSIATGPVGDFIVNWWIFSSDTWVSVASQQFSILTGGTATIGVTETGYYAWTITTTAEVTGTATELAANFTIGINPGMASMTWGQLPLPNIEDVLPVVKAFRTTSVSLMQTNTASPLNRQGQIVGLQLPKGTSFLNYLDFDEVASDLKSLTFSVVNGMYGFLKPTSMDDFDMSVYQFSSATSVVQNDNVFNLIPESDYLLIHSQVVDPNGRQGYWTPAYNVEYESISQWSDLKTADAGPNDLNRALALLPDVPQWHENEFHLDQIWGWIKNTASDIWSGIKEVAPVALAAAPFIL